MNNRRRGRPEKKPGYNREAEIQNLINTAVKLAIKPFDNQVERDPFLPSLTEIAEDMGTTLLRVRKLLITADFFRSEIAVEVQKLAEQGMEIPEIMTSTGLGKASVYSYLPYKKGAYNLDDPTLYSEQSKRYRRRRSAVAKLKEHKGLQDELLYLWKTVVAFEGYQFCISGHGKQEDVKFRYEISRISNPLTPGGSVGKHYTDSNMNGFGDELWIVTDGEQRKKSISRSTVELAYKTGLKLMKTEGCVTEPRKLNTPGAGKYLYPMLIRFGIIQKTL